MIAIKFRKLAEHEQPAPGELWINPKPEWQAERRAISQLVLREKLAALQTGDGPPTQIVVHVTRLQPTLDDMLAAYIAQRLLQGQSLDKKPLSDALVNLAKYAAIIRQGKTASGVPPEEAVESIFQAIRHRAGHDLTDAATAEEFLKGWRRLMASLIRSVKRGADIFVDPLFHEQEFADERADLLDDQQRYNRNVADGVCWTIRLPETKHDESGLLLRQPSSYLFPRWSRHDRATPTGEPYVLLAVAGEEGGWDISTPPALEIKLKSLAERLQQAEDKRRHGGEPRLWYDGQNHHHTIISSPIAGTRLSQHEVLRVVRRWAHARRFVPPRTAATIRTGVLVAAVLIACLVFWFAPRPGPVVTEQDTVNFRRAAPSVAIINTDAEEGSSFLVLEGGWLLTNSHVVRTSRPELKHGARQVPVNFGRFVNGRMQVIHEPVPALIYKDDPNKDMALLKLTEWPSGISHPSFLRLADASEDENIVPGEHCLAIGNPAAATAWTLDTGKVKAVAEYPSESMDAIVHELGAHTSTERKQIEATLAKLGSISKKIIISECNLSSGDSGGPLLNNNGQVIGMSCAVAQQDGRPLGGVSFHIHLDELRAFVHDLPDKPLPYPVPRLPATWPKFDGWTYEASQLSLQGDRDLIKFYSNRGGDVTDKEDRVYKALWLGMRPLDLGEWPDNGEPAADDPIRKGQCKFEFAYGLSKGRLPTAYYDTDGDGTIDLILQAPVDRTVKSEIMPDFQWRLKGEQWVLEQAALHPLLSDDWFTDPDLKALFQGYLHAKKGNLASSIPPEYSEE